MNPPSMSIQSELASMTRMHHSLPDATFSLSSSTAQWQRQRHKSNQASARSSEHWAPRSSAGVHHQSSMAATRRQPSKSDRARQRNRRRPIAHLSDRLHTILTIPPKFLKTPTASDTAGSPRRMRSLIAQESSRSDWYRRQSHQAQVFLKARLSASQSHLASLNGQP